MCGSAELDFDALERGTVYQDGYVAESPTMRYFWKVVHGMTETQKKRLLFFTTGSDRVPIKGLGNLPFVVSKNGTEPRRLNHGAHVFQPPAAAAVRGRGDAARAS